MYALKEAKTYAYIPELQRPILKKKIDSGRGLPRKETLDEDDPERLRLVNTAETPSFMMHKMFYFLQLTGHF